MKAMDLVSDYGLSAVRGGTTEGAYGHGVVEDAVVFDATRSGMLNTTAGAARVALRLQFRRRSGGRLVAVMLAVGLSEDGSWTLRRISVPAEGDRPGEAARLLGAMLPSVLTDTADGTVLMAGKDGVVRAEILSRSGRLVRAKAVEVDLRRPERATRPATHWRSPLGRWFGHAQQSQYA